MSARSVILWSGSHLIDVANPDPALICLRDVARGLARQFRFNGHTITPWSVLQHSILCEELAAAAGAGFAVRLAVLLHDAPEYLLGDVVSPLKTALPDYRRIESAMDAAIWTRFGLSALFADAAAAIAARARIRIADRAALDIERALLLAPGSVGPGSWSEKAPPPAPDAAALVAALGGKSEPQLVEMFCGLVAALQAEATRATAR